MNGKKGRNGGRGRLLSPLGTVIIFLTVAAIITAALLVYDAAERRFAGNRGAIAAVMLTVVIFLSIAGAAIDALRRKITTEGPVGQILDATERIARGDFSVRLTLPRPGDKHNDYGRIMENLNSMAAELAKTEVLRSDFIANVSHEFKTPLAVIQNYAAALRSASGEEERRQYADVLIGETKKLTALVSNILKLNKLENSGLNPARERIRLDEQLEQCALAFEDKIEEKNLQFDCDLCRAEIYSDADCLEIVWNNLLSNAVKFTEPGGKIFLSLLREGGDFLVRISDTGCGISEETGRRIFDKFYQGDTSHAQEGNGLGLALVKRVIGLLGAEISVESELGKGSTFTVRLRSEP